MQPINMRAAMAADYICDKIIEEQGLDETIRATLCLGILPYCQSVLDNVSNEAIDAFLISTPSDLLKQVNKIVDQAFAKSMGNLYNNQEAQGNATARSQEFLSACRNLLDQRIVAAVSLVPQMDKILSVSPKTSLDDIEILKGKVSHSFAINVAPSLDMNDESFESAKKIVQDPIFLKLEDATHMIFTRVICQMVFVQDRKAQG
jgi:hypothetical protein